MIKKKSDIVVFAKQHKKVAISLGVLSILGTLVAYWALYGRFFESTDNAYIKGDLTSIAPKIEGYIKELLVDDGKYVKKGQVLLRIQDQEYRQRLKRLDAQVEEANLTSQQLEVQLNLEELNIKTAQENLKKAEADFYQSQRSFNRSKDLVKHQFASQEKFDSTKTDLIHTKTDLEQMKINLKLAQLKYNDKHFEQKKMKQKHLEMLAAQELARIDLANTTLTAPSDGEVGGRTAQVGQYFRPGMLAMYVVPLDNVWVVANFKETQINRIRVGQPVTIKADAYPNINIDGQVEAVSCAAGSEFSLLPPDNATGNFTKVVQRIPVKILLKKKDSTLLVPGMSVNVSVNIR